MTKAFVSGCAGLTLSAEETAFFRSEQPWGLILFARNVENQEQVKALTAAFRDAVGRQDAPVLIDQEGGRVQRLKPPHWPKYPAPRFFGELHDANPDLGQKAARLGARLIAADLIVLGITVACLPCLDVGFPETVDAIGDRAFSSNPQTVAALGRAMAEGALELGVLPVIKHIPGHGRARVDSHLELPKVAASEAALAQIDYVPFKALADVSLGMTAHLLYEAIDAEAPGTQSRRVIQDVIRKEIGFDGCLMSDDISMKALGGEVGDRSRKIWDAGCDIVLHCNGDLDEMRAVAAAAPELAGKSKLRCQQAMAKRLRQPLPFDKAKAWDEFVGMTGWTGA